MIERNINFEPITIFNYETWVFRLYVVFVTSTVRLLGLIEEVFTTCQNQIIPITKSLPVALQA